MTHHVQVSPRQNSHPVLAQGFQALTTTACAMGGGTLCAGIGTGICVLFPPAAPAMWLAGLALGTVGGAKLGHRLGKP